MGGFGLDLSASGIVATLTSVCLILGILFAVFFYFKKSESITEEDRLNIERSKIAFLAATAMAVVLLFVHFKEQSLRKMMWAKKAVAGVSAVASGLSGRGYSARPTTL
jgi:hypothetical protein